MKSYNYTRTNHGALTNNGTIHLVGSAQINGTVDSGIMVFAPSENLGDYCTIDYAKKTVTVKAGFEVSVRSTGGQWEEPWQDVRQINPDDFVGVRRKAAGSILTTDPPTSLGIQLPSAPSEPTGLQAVDATAGNNGRITGVTAAMEYRPGGTVTWTPCTGTEITGLSSGTYFVRYKATKTSFASQDAQVSLRGPAPEQGICLNDGNIAIRENSNGGIVVEQNGTKYTALDGKILITGNGNSTSNTIMVDRVTAHITLSNVKQDGGQKCPFAIIDSNVRLTLEGNNTMLAQDTAIYARLKDSNTALIIDGPGPLTIGSTESLGLHGI